MTNQEYIHINEAVNVYNKTRQTFYNYINKDLVRSKKINNKLYLNTADIDKLLSDYIEIQEPGNEEIYYTDASGNEIIVNSSQQDTEQHEQINDIALDMLKEDLVEEIHQTQQAILFDTKSLAQQQEQRIMTSLTQRLNVVQQLEDKIQRSINSNKLHQKKTTFRVGFGCVVLVQLLLSLYIL